jgi:hypothetical protein
MPHEPTPTELEQLRDAIFARRKIEAIKLYREFSGCELKAAKDYIEKLTADLETRHPEKFVPKAKGCAVTSALLLIMLLAGILLFVFRGQAEEIQIPEPEIPLPSLQEALDSKKDLWGIAAMRHTNGASYEFFEKLLPPLRYVNAAFRFYPIVLSAPGATVKARLVSNGSAINALAKLNTWKEVGTPVTFRVGTDAQIFGGDSSRLTGPSYEKGYLPIVHLSYKSDDAIYEEETFAATEPHLAEHGVVFVQFKIKSANRSGKISAQIDFKNSLSVSNGWIRANDGAALVWFGKDWKWNATGKSLKTSKPKAILAIATEPFTSTNAPSKTLDFDAQKKQCIAKWESILGTAMRVEVPEPIVNAAWKSTIIGSFMLLSGDEMNYSAGNQYAVMYEAECGDNVRALALWNLQERARKMISPLLDYQINPGLKFHDAAFKLQLLAHYFWLTRDAQFIREQKSRWSKCVAILTNERDAATGLLPREAYCGDEFDKVFSLNSNANGWRGLRDIATVLEEIGEREKSSHIADTAEVLRKATIAAVEKSERRDVQPPFIPIALFGEEKPYDVLTATRRGSYWDLMIPYVIGSEIFAGGERETSMLRYLEEHGGICMGMIRFHQHSGLFANEDGLDDLYGLRYVDALLRRDEPERALVSFYGKLAQGMTRNTFLNAEGTGLRPLDEFGRPMYLPPTCSGNALFLWQLRSMLVQDYDLDNNGEPETLRLLFATPKRWLENGKEIKVENAPTAFGTVSVLVKSQLNKGEILADIKLPQGDKAKKTLFRLRAPDGWKIISAEAGSKSLAVDKDGTMDISKLPKAFKVRAKVKQL